MSDDNDPPEEDHEAAAAPAESSTDDHTPNTSEPMASDTPAADEPSFRNRVERYVRYLLVAGLSLLALITMLRFYFAASATIDTWIAQDYRSLFQALFNLALLLLAGAGIAWQARKIR